MCIHMGVTCQVVILSLSNVYVAAIVTSENYLDNSIRNITNIKE